MDVVFLHVGEVCESEDAGKGMHGNALSIEGQSVFMPANVADGNDMSIVG